MPAWQLEPTGTFKIHLYAEGFQSANPMVFTVEILPTNSQSVCQLWTLWINSILTLYVHLGKKSN